MPAGSPSDFASDTYGYVGPSETAFETSTTGARSLLDLDGSRLAVKSAGTVRWVIFDLHGSVVGLCPAGGTTLSDAYRYDGFGQTIATSGSSANPWKYRGLLGIDPSSGGDKLYDMVARDYAPSSGTFTQLDSVQGGAANPLSMNRYLYALANPATLIDPDGHRSGRKAPGGTRGGGGGGGAAEPAFCELHPQRCGDVSQHDGNGGSGGTVPGDTCDRGCWQQSWAPTFVDPWKLQDDREWAAMHQTLLEACGVGFLRGSDVACAQLDAVRAFEIDNYQAFCASNQPSCAEREAEARAVQDAGNNAALERGAMALLTALLLLDALPGDEGIPAARYSQITRNTQGPTTRLRAERELLAPYPSNNGFVGPTRTVTLPPGATFDRLGPGGRFASPLGTPNVMRSIPYEKLGPPTSINEYHAYEVLKPLMAEAGTVSPYFGQMGLGQQYYFTISMTDLVKAGYLRRIG